MALDHLGLQLISTVEARARGTSRKAWENAVATGEMTRVHTGWFVETASWKAAYPEERELLRMLAVEASARGGGDAFSHTSAAAAHDLPFARFVPRFVHTVSAGSNGRVTGGGLVARHRAVVPAEDVTVVQGLRCTTLARTVADLVGTLPVEAAISIADAALRIVAWDPATRRYDDAAAERWRNELLERLAARAGHRGIGQARWVMHFADGRAQRPGESISRLYLHWLGFAPPRLQVPVPGPGGRTWWLDFGLDDIPAWGDFDGERKYLDPVMLAGKTAARAVLDEKWREDYIRGSTRRAVLRWGDTHISTPAALARRLTDFAVELPRPRARIHMSVRRSPY